MALLGDILFPDAATHEYFTGEMGGRLDVDTDYDTINITLQGRAREYDRIVDVLRGALVTTPLTARECGQGSRSSNKEAERDSTLGGGDRRPGYRSSATGSFSICAPNWRYCRQLEEGRPRRSDAGSRSVYELEQRHTGYCRRRRPAYCDAGTAAVAGRLAKERSGCAAQPFASLIRQTSGL